VLVVHYVGAPGSRVYPIADGVEILAIESHLSGFAVATLGVDRVVGSGDAAVLVDPEHGGDIACVVKLGNLQFVVDQARVLGVSGLD